MKRLSTKQRQQLEAREAQQLNAIEGREATARDETPRRSSRPRPYVTLSPPVRGMFQDAYGQNEIHIPYEKEIEMFYAKETEPALTFRNNLLAAVLETGYLTVSECVEHMSGKSWGSPGHADRRREIAEGILGAGRIQPEMMAQLVEWLRAHGALTTLRAAFTRPELTNEQAESLVSLLHPDDWEEKAVLLANLERRFTQPHELIEQLSTELDTKQREYGRSLFDEEYAYWEGRGERPTILG